MIPATLIAIAWVLTQTDPASGLFTIPSWGRVSLIEAMWLGSGAFAYTLTIRHLPELVADLVSVKRTKSPTLPVTAMGYLVREVLRMLSATGTVLLGLYACFIESPTGPVQVSLVGIILTVVLLGQAILVGLVSYLDWHNRIKIEVLIAEGGDE